MNLLKLNNKSSGQLFLKICFFAMLIFVLVNRFLIFFYNNMVTVDSDVPIMWGGAIDFSNGHFYEPRYYQQNYNTMMEALFAVPFVWCGLPVYYSVPIATHIIFLCPFLFTAFYLYRKNALESSNLVLCLLMCMPTEYDIMTSIPRGFVTGFFFLTFFILSINNPQNFRFIILNCLMAMVGYVVSPNSVLVSIPLILFLYQFHYKNYKFYFLIVFTVICYLPLYYIFDYFYLIHPGYVRHKFSHSFSIKFFIDNIRNLNQCFEYVSFFVSESFIPFLVTLIVLFIVFVKYCKKALIPFISFILIIILMLFSEKSRNGANWPWFSYCRMLIGIPIFVMLFTTIQSLSSTKIMPAIISITIIFSIYKLINIENKMNYYTQPKLFYGVYLVKLETILEHISFYEKMCAKFKVDTFLISDGFWLDPYLTYGGPAISKTFPETHATNSDRRYWVREKFKNRLISKFLFISCKYNFYQLMPKSVDYKISNIDGYGLTLIENNKLPCQQFIYRAKYFEDNY
jgi:hypothetical protein